MQSRKRYTTMSTNEKTGQGPSFADRVEAFGQAHGVVAGIVACAFVFGVLALVFWFTLFSGISSSADFIYAQF